MVKLTTIFIVIRNISILQGSNCPQCRSIKQVTIVVHYVDIYENCINCFSFLNA